MDLLGLMKPNSLKALGILLISAQPTKPKPKPLNILMRLECYALAGGHTCGADSSSWEGGDISDKHKDLGCNCSDGTVNAVFQDQLPPLWSLGYIFDFFVSESDVCKSASSHPFTILSKSPPTIEFLKV